MNCISQVISKPFIYYNFLKEWKTFYFVAMVTKLKKTIFLINARKITFIKANMFPIIKKMLKYIFFGKKTLLYNVFGYFTQK